MWILTHLTKNVSILSLFAIFLIKIKFNSIKVLRNVPLRYLTNYTNITTKVQSLLIYYIVIIINPKTILAILKALLKLI
jgi:hypothetical protein